MQITIIYATYSNSTYTASQVLTEELTKLGHQVVLDQASTATEQALTTSDLIIFASPSWDYDDREGQPHEDFFTFFKRVGKGDGSNFDFAVMALGDKNYRHFCGAAEEITNTATAISGKQVCQPLKIDQYYLNETASMEAIKIWAKKITDCITK